MDSKMNRQKHNNEDIMNKVAITREMCFSLAEEHIRLKDLIDLGKQIFRETKRKASRHSQAVKKTLENVDQYQMVTEERLSKIEQKAKFQNVKQGEMLDEYARKEKSLLGEIAEKVNINNKFQADIDQNLKEISQLSESLATQTTTSRAKEAELTEALKELTISKGDEVSALQTTLDEALSASDASEEKWINEVDSLKLQLGHCQAELEEVSVEVKVVAATNEQITNEKALCEETLAVKELRIVDLTAVKSELEDHLEKSKKYLDEKDNAFEEINKILNQTRIDSLTAKEHLEKELMEKSEKIEQQIAIVTNLETKVLDLEILQSQLQTDYKSLNTTNTSLSESLKTAEEDLAAKNKLVDSKSKEIENLKEMLEKTSLDATADQGLMKQSLEKLREEYKGMEDTLSKKISDLQLQLQNTSWQIEELNGKHCDVITAKKEELSSLKTQMQSQQHEFETTIKHKTDAFTQVQDEMQRMLDEATATSQEKLFSLREAMRKLQSDHEAQICEKIEAFGKAQDELQRMLNESEKNLEQEIQKLQDLTQDLSITKASLDKSLQDKNTVALAFAQKTQECQDVTKKLLIKDCEFSKLMSAVQNLKSRWAAVATPMTPATPITPQQAAVRPTGYSTPLIAGASAVPSTPIYKSTTPVKGRNRALTPQKLTTASNNSTPRSAGSMKLASQFNTPRTPNSAENPKGILRNEGSASKPNRVVFSTPIEQKSAAVVPSDSETSVLDIEVVNKSLQLKRTPETKTHIHPISRVGSGASSSQQSRHSLTTPSKRASTPNGGKELAVTPRNFSGNSTSVSPAMSSQGAGERLPRSKMIKAISRKRLRPTGSAGKKEDLGMLSSKTMKKHRALMEHGRPRVAGMPVRESDSDCFGFGSE